MLCHGMNLDTSDELFYSLVCIFQGVTLGGTGKDAGDRHPKIQEGVLIGAGATILGNIVVGRGAMVAAGSLVLKDVPAHRWVLAYVYAYFPYSMFISSIEHWLLTVLCMLKYAVICSMVAGTPAKVVGFLEESTPSETMKHGILISLLSNSEAFSFSNYK